jgi:hypothetical protein
MGGNASLDIAWDSGERGGFSRSTPESIARGVQWQMLSGYRDPTEAIAESELYEEKKEAEKREAERKFQEAKKVVSEKYPQLTKDDGTDRNIIQKNMRILLKETFPGTKFRVIKSGYNCRNINWTDGPTESEVKKVTDLFNTGHYSPYEDYHYTESTPFSTIFGGCQYVFTNRDFSDDFIAKAIDEVWKQYQTMFEDHEKPTVEMYRKGGMRNIHGKKSSVDFSYFLWEYMKKH